MPCLCVVLYTVCTVRGPKADKRLQLTENEVRDLCLKSREVFLSQPMLLDLEAPLKICGECVSVSARHSLLIRCVTHLGSRRHTRTVLGPSEIV